MKDKFENIIKKHEEKKRLQELANVKNKKKGIRIDIKEKIDQLAQNLKNFANEVSKRRN